MIVFTNFQLENRLKHNISVITRPLELAISKHELKLRATDSLNESAEELLFVSVQHHKSQRSVNHEIVLTLNLQEKFSNNVDWQMQLIRGIDSILHDESSILVRDVIHGVNDPNSVTFAYTNESLPRDQCPEEKLDEILEVNY